MGNSMFDQLQKSGLVDKKKAQKVKQEKYKSKKKKAKKGSEAELSEAARLAQQVHAEKVERDRLLNQQRKEEAERKAIVAQIRQLIETNCVKDRDGEVAYKFTDGTTIKQIYVSEELHNHLTIGRLAIAKLGESYELVPAPVAEKISQRDESYIISQNEKEETGMDEDDPYADYQIPDDLMW